MTHACFITSESGEILVLEINVIALDGVDCKELRKAKLKLTQQEEVSFRLTCHQPSSDTVKFTIIPRDKMLISWIYKEGKKKQIYQKSN